MIDGVKGVSDEAAAQARDASDAATRQMRALEGLAETSRGLAQLAERLRLSTGRFTVPQASLTAGTLSTESEPNDAAKARQDAIRPVAGSRAPGRSLTAA
jgi:hypothetical protein